MDKWEMCIYSIESITFHSPKNGTSTFPVKEFILKFVDPQYKASWNTASGTIALQWILNNGWEPYANITGAFYFRRKLESAE